jgi:hypothetical protein
MCGADEYVMDADGTHVRRVTLAPDGSAIAFSAFVNDSGSTRITLVPSSGGTPIHRHSPEG